MSQLSQLVEVKKLQPEEKEALEKECLSKEFKKVSKEKKKEEPDVFFFSPWSRSAHQTCYAQMEPLLQKMYEIYETKFEKDNYHAKNRLQQSALAILKQNDPEFTTLENMYKNLGKERVELRLKKVASAALVLCKI